MDQEPRVELLVQLSRTISPTPLSWGLSSVGQNSEKKGSGLGIFPSWAMASHKAVERCWWCRTCPCDTLGVHGGAGGALQELGGFAGGVCARNEPFAAPSQNTPRVEAGASWAEPPLLNKRQKKE